MLGIRPVLLLLAFLSFFLATIGVPATRINLVALGLALWVLSLLV